jgi:LCP family protein required for cell wall assembly
MSDDGFGPVQRGRGGKTASAPTSPAPPKPAARRDRGAGDGFGPTVSGGPGGRGKPLSAPPESTASEPAALHGRTRRPVRTLLLVLLLAVALVALSGVGALAYATVRIDRVPVDGLRSAGAQMNILVVGSDSRDGLSAEELQRLGTEAVAGKRTDTIFLLSVRGQRAAMLSFPRDLYVTRCDGSQGRINAAFQATDGPSCLVQTVSQLSGLPVTHYLEINFLGFRDIVDAVGGVDVVLDTPITDLAAGVDLPAGCNSLDGSAALGFVRARSIDDDLGRIGRQQYFLQQLARRAAAPATVLNPLRLFPAAGAVGGSLIADRGFGPVDFVRLGLGGRGLAAGGLPTLTVPATPRSVGGAAVLVVQDGPAAAVFDSFRSGAVFDQPGDQPAPQAAAGLTLGAVGFPALLAQSPAPGC